MLYAGQAVATCCDRLCLSFVWLPLVDQRVLSPANFSNIATQTSYTCMFDMGADGGHLDARFDLASVPRVDGQRRNGAAMAGVHRTPAMMTQWLRGGGSRSAVRVRHRRRCSRRAVYRDLGVSPFCRDARQLQIRFGVATTIPSGASGARRAETCLYQKFYAAASLAVRLPILITVVIGIGLQC